RGPREARDRVDDLGKIAGAGPDRLLGKLLVVDVVHHAMPGDDLAGIVAQCPGLSLAPAILALTMQEAHLVSVWRARGDATHPGIDGPRAILRMHQMHPFLGHDLLVRPPEPVEHRRIEIVDQAARRGAEKILRNGLREAPEIELALAQPAFRLLHAVDVDG